MLLWLLLALAALLASGTAVCHTPTSRLLGLTPTSNSGRRRRSSSSSSSSSSSDNTSSGNSNSSSRSNSILMSAALWMCHLLLLSHWLEPVRHS
jgi:hypothetical protein